MEAARKSEEPPDLQESNIPDAGLAKHFLKKVLIGRGILSARGIYQSYRGELVL